MSVTIDDLKNATTITQKNQYRPLNSYDHPGGLIDLTLWNKPVIIIGDLHGSIENLNAILEDAGNYVKIKTGEAFLIIVGDGMHNDQTGEMLEMGTSLAVLERLIELTLDLKDNFIYIRGNHDSFDERVTKSGIRQGYEFKKYLLQEMGDLWVDCVDKFFEALPMVIIGDRFMVTHAGPIRRGATRQEMIDLEDNPDFIRQLMWNRVHEFRGNPSLKEYDGQDIKSMLEKMKMPPDSYYIVGHNPLWQTGNTTGIWQDVTGIKNHIIIITNRQTNGPYLIVHKGSVRECFAIEIITESYNGW